MSDITTIARPYARAIFELALETKQLSEWSDLLSILSLAVSLPEVVQFIRNPEVTQNDYLDLLMTVAAKAKSKPDNKLITHFVSLLAENKRLLLLPYITIEYERSRAKQEKTLVVTVNTFNTLTDKQQQKLIHKLTERFQRQVKLEIIIDESLLGGAIIQAGDVVIDGSVKGQLIRLATTLSD
jgi:F-type H+-transporting ATPase subunit delta